MINYPYKLDLIIIDLMLPGDISGYDVFDAIRETPDLANTPMIVVSAADPDVEIPRAKEKGFKSYISKPINRQNFPEQILNIINGEQIWGGKYR